MRRHTVSLVVVLLAACGDPPSHSNPPAARSLTMVGGDGQVGASGTPLSQPLVVLLRDDTGAPLELAAVTFEVIRGGGVLLSATGTTDADGLVATVWILGSGAEQQLLRITSDQAEPIEAEARLGDATCQPVECRDGEFTGPIPFHLVTLPTYEGSGQAVHPDVMQRPEQPLLPVALAFTPYPGGNALHEDPSLAESANARHWRVPLGVSNPLARSASGHLSDPDIVRDLGTGAQSLYYREVTGGRNRIHLMTSGNGTTWVSRGVVLDVASHQALSPTVVQGGPAAPWNMWTVNSGSAGCSAASTVVERRSSSNGVQWGDATVTDLAQPGQVIWHLDVQWLAARNEYWALYNSYPTGGTCVTRALFLARSSDGLHWSTPQSPLMTAGRVPAFNDVVYRSTFRISPDGAWLELLLSGAVYQSSSYTWRVGRMVIPTGDAIDGDFEQSVPDADWRHPDPDPLPPPEPFDQP